MRSPLSRYEMYDVLRVFGKPCAEIGVLRGDNATEILKRNPSSLILVDPWIHQNPKIYGIDSANVGDNEFESIYQSVVDKFKSDNRVKIKRQFSNDAATSIQDGTLFFIHIDAIHTVDGCLNDMRYWWPKLSPGGYLTGHDWSWGGVRQAVVAFLNENPDLKPILTGGDVCWIIQKPPTRQDHILRRPDVWGYFDKAFVINRNEDDHRLIRIDKRLAIQAITYERLSAFYAPQSKSEQYVLPGYIGCAMSHLECIRKAMASGLRNVLIFEDDCILRDDASELMWSKIVPELNATDWDILYLGAYISGDVRRISDHLYAHDEAYQCHAYAVNASGFASVERACLETIEKRLVPQDVALTHIKELAKIHTIPLLAIQECGYSNNDECYADHLNEYDAYYDLKEFTHHCEEARRLYTDAPKVNTH